MLEPEPEPELALAAPGPTAQGFFGEMARLACGGPGRSFNTRITGGQTYVAGAYYQESSHAAFHMKAGSGGPGRVAVAVVKMYTFDWVQTLLEGWDGLFYL